MLKIAFLFLCVGDIYHQDFWQFFFQGNQDRYSIYVHSKESLPQDSYFKEYEMSVKVPTTWANSVEAQYVLLKEALKDQDNQKFIFASESTLPLQSFDMIYHTVMSDPRSIFSYHKNRHSSINNSCYAYRSLRLIDPKFHYKTTQWVILNRKHAELIVQDVEHLQKITQYEADNELYFATFLASQGLLHEVLPVDKTYVDWSMPNKDSYARKFPHEYDDLSDEYNANQIVNAINNDVLFMRKFPHKADLSSLTPYVSYYPCASNVIPCECALYNRCVKERYKIIQSVVTEYSTPISVFDCGARQGFYAHKIAQDYSAVCILWEHSAENGALKRASQVWDFYKHIYNDHKVILFNSEINARALEKLGTCTTFDVILAFNLIELFGREWHQVLQSLLKMGQKIIVEIPENGSLEVMDMQYYVLKKYGTLLGELQEDGKVMSTLYLLENDEGEFPVKV